jgi:uncharacterized protein involved in response to NO
MVYVLTSSNALVITILSMLAGFFQAVRLWGWYLHALWQHPMLWILFLGYAWIPGGLFLFAYASYSGNGYSSAVHAFTAGTIGLLTIGMMSRVSLGHTGRNIEASAVMVVAFVFVVLGSLLRVTGSLTYLEVIEQHYSVIVMTAGILWAAGFLLFVIAFIPVLTRPRVDNRPG